MPLLNVLLILVLAGVVLFLVNKFLSEYIDGKILKIINIVVVVAVIIWLVGLFFGGFGSLSSIRVGR